MKDVGLDVPERNLVIAVTSRNTFLHRSMMLQFTYFYVSICVECIVDGIVDALEIGMCPLIPSLCVQAEAIAVDPSSLESSHDRKAGRDLFG